MDNSLRRRLFLQLLALSSAKVLTGCDGGETTASGGSGGTAGTGGTGGSGGSSGGGKNVVVVGGGLAGLCSAYELKKKGYNIVAILEAQTRTGGRVLTLRDGWKNGQYSELGATRVASSHNYTLGYIDEFGLTKKEFTGGDALYSLKGQPPFVKKDADPWPDFLSLLTAAEKTMDPDSIVFGYEKLDELGDPTALDWPTGKALDYKDMGIFDYLKANGASDDVLLLDRAINGGELTSDTALYWLMADVVDKTWNQTYAIVGGNDQLPAKFTEALTDVVKYECPVTAIAQDSSGVTVTYMNGGMSHTVTGDLCVVAIPFTMLRKINITPALSDTKAAVVKNMKYMSVSRCNIQTKTRFWTNAPYSVGGLKIARTDTPIERLWDLSNVQDGPSGLFVAYMQNQSGLDFQAQPEAMRVDYVKNVIKGFFPEIDTEFDSAQSKIWQEDPWVEGAWGYYAKGDDIATWMPAAKEPEGRLFFCGEHTSPWSGWMQGAFESAHRVVAQVTG